jgi:hypothetical protein
MNTGLTLYLRNKSSRIRGVLEVCHVGHRGSDCTENEVSPLEFKWRMIAASIKKGAMATVGPLSVNLVSSEGNDWVEEGLFDRVVAPFPC